jgi:endoglucanase
MLGELLFELVQIPGPSGYEGRVAERLRSELQPLVDEVRIDRVGNVIATKRGSSPGKALMVVAHTDEVSLVVEGVDDFVWFQRVGWIDERVLMGVPVTILGRRGDIDGVVCSLSAHLSSTEAPGELWIDVGRRVGEVSVGDPIVFASNARWLSLDRKVLASKAIDDRVGCALLVALAQRLPPSPRHTIHLVGAAQEEVGSFGAQYAARELGPQWVIVLDTGYAQDGAPHRGKTGIMGRGPVLRRFQMTQPTDRLYPAALFFSSQRLNDLALGGAERLGLPIQVDISCSTFTDTSLIHAFDPSIETCTLLLPRRYSHSPLEVFEITNAENCLEILVEMVAGLEGME